METILKPIKALCYAILASVVFVTVFDKYHTEMTYQVKDDAPLSIPQAPTEKPSTGFESVTSHLPSAIAKTISKATLKQINCMALNNYYEAATEGVTGMMAVSQVVLNRMAYSGFPETACAVIYQKTQFSWTFAKSLPPLDMTSEAWKNAVQVAKVMYLERKTVHGLENALFYHADYVKPRWSNLRVVKKVGTHIFYRVKEQPMLIAQASPKKKVA